MTSPPKPSPPPTRSSAAPSAVGVALFFTSYLLPSVLGGWVPIRLTLSLTRVRQDSILPCHVLNLFPSSSPLPSVCAGLHPTRLSFRLAVRLPKIALAASAMKTSPEWIPPEGVVPSRNPIDWLTRTATRDWSRSSGVARVRDLSVPVPEVNAEDLADVSAANDGEFGVAATITCTSLPPGVQLCTIVIGSTVLARALLPINTNTHIVRVDGSDIDSATRGVGPCRAQLNPRRAVPTLGNHGLRIEGRDRRSSQQAGGNHRNEILRASLLYEPYEPLRTRLLNVNKPRYITPKTLGDGTTITTRIPSQAPPIQGNSPVDAYLVTESE